MVVLHCTENTVTNRPSRNAILAMTTAEERFARKNRGSGKASIDKVAGPVGEALIMTALGLFVAVPAVLGYNWLLRRNKGLQDSLRNFSGDLHAYLVGGARMTAGDHAAGHRK